MDEIYNDEIELKEEEAEIFLAFIKYVFGFILGTLVGTMIGLWIIF